MKAHALSLCASFLVVAALHACGDGDGGEPSGGQGGTTADAGAHDDGPGTSGGRAGSRDATADAGNINDATTGGGDATGGKGGAAGSGGTAGTAGKGGQGGAGTAGTGGSAGQRDGGSGTGGTAGSGTGGAGGASGTGGASGAAGASGANGTTDGGGAGDGGIAAGDLIAAPNGVDSAPGTLAEPTTLTAAISRVAAGKSIHLRGGTYVYAVQVTIDHANSGAQGGLKNIVAYAAEKPVLDFSSQPYGTGSNPRGLEIDGSYWHVMGLEVKGSADNGIYVAGSNNVVERCLLHDNRDTGLQIGRESSSTANADWPSNNLILDCESYDNYDAPPGTGENADGFAAKLTVGSGNVFRGCISHHNIDDGWDLFTKQDTGPIGPVTIDQCVSHHNGTLTNGTTNPNGDRNGFKLGGDSIAVAHIVTRSVAFDNGKNGFTWNSNHGEIHVFNCLAFDNVEGNFKFGDNATPTTAVFANDVSFWTASGAKSDKAVGTDLSNTNCWWDVAQTQPSVNGKGLVVDASDFATPLGQPVLARKADGSIDFAPFRLAAGSDLLNAGVVPPGTLPFDAATYYQGAPDLGAIEAP